MVKIEDIKKELEKLKTDKDRINYLESLLESLKDKKLIQEIKNLIQTLQNLEVEIEGHSPEFDLRDLIKMKISSIGKKVDKNNEITLRNNCISLIFKN